MKADDIPFMVEGTTSSPKFVPDVKGMAGSLLNGATSGKPGQNNPISGLIGNVQEEAEIADAARFCMVLWR